MKEITIDTKTHKSQILIGESLGNLPNYLPEKKTVIITDQNILDHYAGQFPDCPVIRIGLGEKNKTLSTIEDIISRLLELEVDRTWYLLAVGGGIVCDVAGFAASIYMRGLSFGFVSTTLLSQVDASVGGKNGVNFQGYKNMVGVFNQPEFVLCDPGMLKTLEEREYISGFAEVIKAAAIRDSELFNYLENRSGEAMEKNSDFLEHIVYKAVEIKARVVEDDEKEKGERKILNFGHTAAHAIEKLTGILHGQAVSIGMVIAAELSCQKGFLSKDKAKRIKDLIAAYRLPVESPVPVTDVLQEMTKDKKREGDSVHYILLDDIGKCRIEKITYNELEELLNDLR
jgi:3-dehydroquinate synthase